MTRLARGKLEIAREAVDVHEVLRQAVDVSRGRYRGQQQKLIIALRARRHTVMGTAPASNRFSGICSRTLPNLLPRRGNPHSIPNRATASPQSFPTMGWGSTPRVYPSSSIRLPRAASRLPKNSAGLDLVWLYRRQLSMHTMEVYVRRVGAMKKGATFIVELPLRSGAKT